MLHLDLQNLSGEPPGINNTASRELYVPGTDSKDNINMYASSNILDSGRYVQYGYSAKKSGSGLKKYRKNDNVLGKLSLEDYDSMLSGSRMGFGATKRSQSHMARSPDLRSNATKLQAAAAKLRH